MTTIRRADDGDAAAITGVLRSAFAEYRPLYTARGFAATTPDELGIIARMQEGPVWVAVDGSHVVGTLSAVLQNAQVYLRGMAILPESAGQGIGRLLLGEAEEFARSAAATSFLLSTTPFLDRAIRLYECYGFRRTDEGPHELHGTPLFSMRKDLR